MPTFEAIPQDCMPHTIVIWHLITSQETCVLTGAQCMLDKVACKLCLELNHILISALLSITKTPQRKHCWVDTLTQSKLRAQNEMH